MNFSPKPHPLIAHWLPGSVAIILIYFWHHNCWSLACFGDMSRTQLGLFVIASIAVGEMLDAVRDIGENLFECWCPEEQLNWEFFLEADEKKLDNFENYFYTYYVLCSNFALGLFPVLVLEIIRHCFAHWKIDLLLAVAVGIFVFDAILLRKQIRDLIGVQAHEEK